MKTRDFIIAGAFFLGVGYLLTIIQFDSDEPSFYVFVIIMVGIFVFNFLARKSYSLKPYFTSKFNVLTSKYNSVVSGELPKDLMFQKMFEVLRNQGLKVVFESEQNLQIIATKGISWKSWGENIYIDFTEKDSVTQMNFTFTTVMGIFSWGANEKNYSSLLFNFEESLTI
jgi:hypothetical protein